MVGNPCQVKGWPQRLTKNLAQNFFRRNRGRIGKFPKLGWFCRWPDQAWTCGRLCGSMQQDGLNPLKNELCSVFAGWKDIAVANSGKMAGGGVGGGISRGEQGRWGRCERSQPAYSFSWYVNSLVQCSLSRTSRQRDWAGGDGCIAGQQLFTHVSERTCALLCNVHAHMRVKRSGRSLLDEECRHCLLPLHK